MDQLPPQMQNPNVPPSTSAGPTPMVPPTMPAKNKKPLFFIVIAVIVAVGLGIWWYIGQMVPEPIVEQQPVVDQEAREDAMIGNEIQDVDLGDIDADFEQIDKDMNSL